MDRNKEDEIRTRAYALWEEEGRPDGKQEDHWRRAAEEQGQPRPDEEGETTRVRRTTGRTEPFEDLTNEGSTD